MSGSGTMQVDGDFFSVRAGDTIIVPDGAFHKVFNYDSESDLVFIAIFEKYSDRV